MSLLLLRHGQIKANRQGRWHGSTDSPLNWRGRRQARRTARYLTRTDTPITAIYSSPLVRCQATAEPVARRLDLKVENHPDLREYGIGCWEDTTFADLARDHDFFAQATTDADFRPPDGESLRQVCERVVPTLQNIDRRHPEGRVLVVSHGVALAVALAMLIDGDPARWPDYPLGNCSLTELVLSPVAYVNFFNATQHL